MTDTVTTTTATAAPVDTAASPATAVTQTVTTTPTLDLSGLFDLVPGIQTSELWVVVATAIGGVLAKLGVLCTGATCAAGQFSDQDFAVLLGSALFYAFGRWVLKNKSLTLTAAIQQILNQPAK